MATMVQAIRMALHVGEEASASPTSSARTSARRSAASSRRRRASRPTWNTPLDERGIVGMAIGLALAGRKPVAEIQFCDYAFNTVDLLKIAGNTYWSSGGDWNVPLVMMTPVGAGIRGSIYHSHSFDAQATRIPGWKIVMPSNPRDAYGLLLSAIKDPNPVMFLEAEGAASREGPARRGRPRRARRRQDALEDDRRAARRPHASGSPEWPKLEELYIPIGKARIARAGTQVTVLTYGRNVPMCVAAAEELAADNIDAEIVDLRSLHPYDWEAIKESVRKTNRVSASTRTPRSRTSAST